MGNNTIMMENIKTAIDNNIHIKLTSQHGPSSVALRAFNGREDGTIILRSEARKFLRILPGRTDLNGGQHGPWTIFSVTAAAHGDGVLLQAIKSGRWLHVEEDGEFTSGTDALPLRVELLPDYEPMHIDDEPAEVPLEMPAVDPGLLSADDIT